MFTVAMDPATMNRGRAGTHAGSNHAASSPESAIASELFDQFVAAGTFKAVLSTFRQICEVLRIKPTNFPNFYPRLKAKLKSWKAASLWSKIDKRASHKCYNRGKACPNTRILIIGAGPCGLRTAIEAQLLGAKVVVIEKRDRFSRNNVLHLWPFVIHDLRNLGAKKFFGKFCAGAIDHISIRQLQLILLKVALLLGVEVHENVSFEELREPPEDQSVEHIGWRAGVSPPDHPVSQYEFDVLIGADGKRNTLHGFNRKEFRGKLAIAITANFINRHTMEEARIPEISGVAFIFNQKFFQDMKEQTGIDLENIVYYKDDTHYFVMTAKKQSLLERGVIIKDYSDTARLLAPENVDREALMEYARDAADFATNYQMPHLEFAVNHYGQADVAMFDFTSMYAAESASRVCERRSHKLLQGLVGDSLLEPFWPTGSGCARGFLSAFDAAWMIRSWASGKMSPCQVLAERESVYRLLAQTTPENLSKDFNKYSLNPASRYPNLNTHAVLPSQIQILYDTDSQIKDQAYDVVVEVPKKRRRRDSIIHPEALLAWCQRQVASYEDIKIENMSNSWKSGMALCAIIHHYRPDLIDLKSLNPEDAAKNNQLAFDICEREFGIPPIMTGQEMADCDVPDTLAMVSYISQIYETFRGEIPYVVRPAKDSLIDEVRIPSSQSHPSALSILSKIGHKLQNKRRYSLERDMAKDKAKNETIKRSRIASALISKRRSRDKGIAVDLGPSEVTLTHYAQTKNIGERPSFTSRVQTIEEKLLKDSGLRVREEELEAGYLPKGRLDPDYWNLKMLEEKLRNRGTVAPQSPGSKVKVGRIQKDDWNVKMLEERLKQKEAKAAAARDAASERPKVLKDIFESKLQSMDARLKASGGLTAEEEVKFGKFDLRLKQLDQHLKEGSNLDVGVKGSNWVSAMAEHMAAILENKPSNRPLPPVGPAHPNPTPTPPNPNPPPSTPSLLTQCSQNNGSSAESSSGGSEICYFCRKRVYLMERLSAQGLFFHRSCFRCEYCNTNLRLQHYAFDPTGACGGKFYCYQHFRKQKPDARWQEMMRRKEAFLSGELDRKEGLTPLSSSPTLSNEQRAPASPQKTEPEPVREVPEIKISEVLAEKKPAPSYVEERDSSAILITPKFVTPKAAPKLLSEPSLSSVLRDRTPERVEYENSLELSEEELLTSELEEEELTQKNLGSVHEVATSDDEYSDLSTDSESEEEAYAEELERSLTADETRKLAESWKKRYSKEPVAASNRDEGSSEESEEDEESLSTSEGSATETGTDATSGDIDSDAEYSTEEEDHHGLDLEKTPVQEKDLLNCISAKTPSTTDSEEETSELEDSEELSDSEGVSESDEESEPEPEPPKHQIPTIIIEESPPQDNVEEEDWAEKAAAVLKEKALTDGDEPQAQADNNAGGDTAELVPLGLQGTEEAEPKSVSESVSSAHLGSQETLVTSMSDIIENLVQSKEEAEGDKDASKEEGGILIEAGDAKEVHPNVPIIVDDGDNKDKINNEEINNPEPLVCISEGVSPILPAAATETPLQHLAVGAGAAGVVSSNSSPGVSGASPQEGVCSVESMVVAGSSTSSPPKSQERPWGQGDNGWVDILQSPVASCSGTDRAMADNSYGGPLKALSSSDESEMMMAAEANNVLRISGSSSEFPTSDSGELKAQQSDSNHQSPSEGGDTTNISYELSSDTTENNFGKSSSSSSSDQNVTPSEEEFANQNNESLTTPIVEVVPNCISMNEDVVVVAEITSSTSSSDIKDITDIDNISDRQVCPVQSLTNTGNEIDADEITHSDWAKDDLISGMEDLEELTVDPKFITVRSKKNKGSSKNIFEWDEDDDLSSGSVSGENKEQEEDKNDAVMMPKKDLDSPKILNVVNSVRRNSADMVSPRSTNGVAQIGVKKQMSDVTETIKVSPAKFQGYSGSFAEKVRPRSLVGDSSIYLKSLNINLQKLDFPSLNKNNTAMSNENLNESSELNKKTDDMTTNNKIQDNDNNKMLLYVTGNKRQRIASQGESSVSSSSTSEHSDDKDNAAQMPQEVPQEEVVVVRRRQKEKDQKQQQTKEKRLSVHDVGLSVPFADDELRSLCSEDVSSPDSELPDVFPLQSPEDGEEVNAKMCSTPMKNPNLIDEIRLQRTVEQEKARQQARERARLKSDEELGLSPKNYRKKYGGKMQPSVSHYEELISGDFLDEVGEEELEDDEMMASILESPFLVKRVDVITQPAVANTLTVNSAGKHGSAFTPESSEETTGSSRSRLSAISPGSVELLSVGGETASSNKTTPTTDTSKTDGANYLESSISVDDIDVSMAPQQTIEIGQSTGSSKGATSESSPEILDVVHKGKSLFPTRPKVRVTDVDKGEEKPKTPNKTKNFFSLLSFGKNNSREKKDKTKEMDKERSASLPADLAKKTPPKERSFPRLKLPRSREKSRDRHKKKYQVTMTDESGKSGNNSSRESILDNDKPVKHVDFSPTPPPLKLFFDVEPSVPSNQLLQLNPLANGIAPKASEDSFSDTEEDTGEGKSLAVATTSLAAAGSSGDKREKSAGSKEAKAQRVVQKVHRQQELKRLRAAQEIQRHLEELEIKQRELEERGVEVEKALRGEGERVSLNKSDTELMQDWFDLVHEKSRILREEQELLIRAKDLELEDRHSRLQQDMRERMARDDSQKTAAEIEEEGKILAEMLEIVEKRDELVAMLDQLRVKEVEEDKNFESKMAAKALQFSPPCKS